VVNEGSGLGISQWSSFSGWMDGHVFLMFYRDADPMSRLISVPAFESGWMDVLFWTLMVGLGLLVETTC